jgi:hypothetical protein
MKEDFILIGILPESLVEHKKVQLTEIKSILVEALQLGSMYNPMVDLLKQKNLIIDGESVCLKDLFSMIKSKDFLQTIPLFCNQRETYSNIQLIIVGIILTQRGELKKLEIREGLSAYVLAAREAK